MIDAAGFELHIVIFIRSKLDYINSRYIYSLKHFITTKPLSSLLTMPLKGELQNEKPKRDKIKRRQDVFDFWNYFKPLLKAKSKGLKMSFLPFRQGGVDPFEQFILTINLSTALPWKPCLQKHYNRSPRNRGVWLARVLSQLLRENNISPKTIDNFSQLILKEGRQRRWNEPSFWGYSRKLTKKATLDFETNNAGERPIPPQSIEAEVRMHAAAQRLLDRIKRQQTSVTASPLKRLIRMTLGTQDLLRS